MKLKMGKFVNSHAVGGISEPFFVKVFTRDSPVENILNPVMSTSGLQL